METRPPRAAPPLGRAQAAPLRARGLALSAAAAALVAAALSGTNCKRRTASIEPPRDLDAGPAASGAPAISATPPGPTAVSAAEPGGRLEYEVRDAATSALIPARLTLLGAAGTPDPALAPGDSPRQEGRAIAAFNRVMSLSGQGSVEVPRGTYDVYVSRGPEWDISITRGVTIGPHGAAVRASIGHAVDTRGWLSGDFHVHADASYDSRVPMSARVYEFAAEGVDMIVSTDHNVVTDYAPLIAELGAGAYLTSATGDEITTPSSGHFGAFPLRITGEPPGHGAIAVGERTPKAILRSVRATAPDALIDVHHPRFPRGMGYFTEGGLDAGADRAASQGFSFDFDAVEILNGYQDADRASVEPVLQDWFGLLSNGHIVAATGNSDTHYLDHTMAGYPRNYVRLQDDSPAAARPADVVRSVKGLHAFFTTGPFVRLTVGEATYGDLGPAPGGEVHGEIAVQAAPWVSVSTVILYVNGVEERRLSVPDGTAVARFRAGFGLSLERDAFLVARVEGDRPMAPVVGSSRFRVLPFALTNPVFLDADGDGRFTPPRGGRGAGKRHPARPVVVVVNQSP